MKKRGDSADATIRDVTIYLCLGDIKKNNVLIVHTEIADVRD